MCLVPSSHCLTSKRQDRIFGAQLVGNHVMLDFSVKADGPNPFLCNFSTCNDKQIPLHFKRSFSECSFQVNPYRLES